MTEFQILRLTNSRDHEVALVVEPWGEIYPMPAGATFDVRFEVAGERFAQLPEIVWEAEQILLYAGVGGDIELHHNGRNLRAVSLNSIEINLTKAA